MHVGLGRPKFPGDNEMILIGWDRDYSKIVLQEGLAVLALDQRGMGENGGDPEKGNPGCSELAKRASCSPQIPKVFIKSKRH